MKKKNTIKKASKKEIEKSASYSLKLEGISLSCAKKNSKVIKLLQKYGRAFSV